MAKATSIQDITHTKKLGNTFSLSQYKPSPSDEESRDTFIVTGEGADPPEPLSVQLPSLAEHSQRVTHLDPNLPQKIVSFSVVAEDQARFTGNITAPDHDHRRPLESALMVGTTPIQDITHKRILVENIPFDSFQNQQNQCQFHSKATL
ncbi:hypothetical protein DFH28DRAFT_701043 [Melampsora americana]|nr:hypothetical protein DFH28DRAFT_701043 [Melampsora americana]